MFYHLNSVRLWVVGAIAPTGQKAFLPITIYYYYYEVYIYIYEVIFISVPKNGIPKIGTRFKMPSRKDFFKKCASEVRLTVSQFLGHGKRLFCSRHDGTCTTCKAFNLLPLAKKAFLSGFWAVK